MRLLVIIILFCLPPAAHAVSKNGFDLDNAAIPVSEIVSGGPPRDGIPALTDPDFIPADEARYLDGDDRILGVVIGGQARAYPIAILNWHEIVNDHIGTQHYVVTYCPLCGSGVVFASNVADGGALKFGVSGLLYNSNVLLYDRQTESLWSQLGGEAISGKLEGVELPQLPAMHTTWRAWRKRHPDTLVLDRNTGYRRNYDRNPYRGYERTRRLYFDASHKVPATYHPKEQVLGIEIDGKHKAYPFKELSEYGKAEFADSFAGEEITIVWNEQERTAFAKHSNGMTDGVVAYWFAWFTFHPQTAVFTAAERERR